MKDITQNKANFKALREYCGLTQDYLAKTLCVDLEQIKKWENPVLEDMPSFEAWTHVLGLKQRADMRYEQMLNEIYMLREEEWENLPVVLTYYASQEQYDENVKTPHEEVSYENALTFRIATFLQDAGAFVSFAYPGDKEASGPQSLSAYLQQARERLWDESKPF